MDPKWRGKIVMANPTTHATTISWLVGLKEQIFSSEDTWMKFVKDWPPTNQCLSVPLALPLHPSRVERD